MLSQTDTPFEQFIPYFTNAAVPVCFLVPTETGYRKNIMDATFSVRTMLKNNNIHDYALQEKGQENKIIINGYYVNSNTLTPMDISLYRPNTKDGDPRIWFSKLTKYCVPYNLLALFAVGERIFVANLSNAEIADSLRTGGYLAELVQQAANQVERVSQELLSRIQEIHNRGFIQTVTNGDPGVGDTLENALGIARNNNPVADYQGIELKATRGTLKNRNRNTLFTQVPKWNTPNGLTEKEILNTYGYMRQHDTRENVQQLHCTLKSQQANAQGLFLSVENDSSILCVKHQEAPHPKFVTLWEMDKLKERLLEKHPATFWVQAATRFENGIEYFRYDKIKYTRNPNVQIFADLLDAGIITIDFLMYLKENGTVRNHGYPFKIAPRNIEMLFPRVIDYDLT